MIRSPSEKAADGQLFLGHAKHYASPPAIATFPTMRREQNPKPERGPDEEEYGEGKAPAGVQTRAEEAYYAELYIDAMGDPIHAPRGWWHLKLWKGR